MKYILFFKNNIAVAKSCYSATSIVDLGVYDEYAEVTYDEYNSIELPCKKVDGLWVKTDVFPNINYPEFESVKESSEDYSITSLEQLRADIDFIAAMTGVEL